MCQMMPPSRLATRSCAALTPKYWLWRQVFLMPASKTMKSWMSSSNRSFEHSCGQCPVERLLDVGRPRFHSSQYFSGVSMTP